METENLQMALTLRTKLWGATLIKVKSDCAVTQPASFFLDNLSSEQTSVCTVLIRQTATLRIRNQTMQIIESREVTDKRVCVCAPRVFFVSPPLRFSSLD